MSKKRTHEEFVKLMMEKHPSILVVGTYMDSLTPVELRCLKCGHEWATKPPMSLKGHGCPSCGGSMRLTHEIFIDRIYKLGAKYKVLDQYVKSTSTVRCCCDIDGYVWNALPQTLLRGRGCPKCAGNLTKTHSDFINEMSAVTESIEVIGTYRTARTPIEVRCKIDGHVWNAMPTNLLKGCGCPRCSGNYTPTRSDFEERMSMKRPNIEVLSEYTTMSQKVMCRCKIDGCTWSTTPSILMSDMKYCCPKCGGTKRLSQEEFISLVHDVHPNLMVLSTYKNARSKVLIQCKTCGQQWEQQSIYLLNGHGCDNCDTKLSKGEKRISAYLKSRNIEHIYQYRFSDCKSVHQLPFDFFIPGINMAIEYDGRQHFEPVQFGGSYNDAIAEFHNVQHRDGIKTDYCSKHNIKLLRIPYTEFDNIEQILDKHLL